MQEKIAAQIESYWREREELITEANERVQRHQMAAAEHNARMLEIQGRVNQIEGALQALQSLVEDTADNRDS